MSEREIIRRRARATGTIVVLVHSPEADADQPWETICEEHGGVCSHQTRYVAEMWLSHPDEWCEDCMHGEGTLDGTREIESDRSQGEPDAAPSRSAGIVPTDTTTEEVSMARKTSNGSKTDQTRKAREAKAAEAAKTTPTPEPAPVTELPSTDVDGGDLAKALVARVKTDVSAAKEEKKKAYSRIVVGKTTVAYLTPGKRGLAVEVSTKKGDGPRELDRVKVTSESQVETVAKQIIAAAS